MPFKYEMGCFAVLLPFAYWGLDRAGKPLGDVMELSVLAFYLINVLLLVLAINLPFSSARALNKWLET